jgi:ABC-2 type transport system ATP-binding protein
MMIETVLKFKDLHKSYDGKEVLKGINAEARTGDVIGLIGLNGSGKTTLLETALGFSLASEGTASIFDTDITRLISKELKTRIGYVPQVDELLEVFTGKRYLDLIASFYDNWNDSLVKRLCETWDVPVDQKIHTLSVGQRQKLSIVSALGHEPELIVFDEPVASLDPLARRLFLKELVDIAASQTCTILFSTHIVSDLERIASRVWLIKDGRISIDDSLDSLKERTARINLPPGVPVPNAFLNDELIHHRIDGNSSTLIFSNWSPEQHKKLEQETGCSLDQIGWLSLEDIFLEVHA